MTSAVADSDLPTAVTTALYLSTKALHVEAERTGVVRDMLRGQASRTGYTLLLRNLLPVYRALEHGLERHRDSTGLSALARFRVNREAAIESDLVALAGPEWNSVALLPAGEAYAARVAEVSEGDGSRLIAHAYTRYLGDLSGGQILRKLLARAPGLKETELSFYDWPEVSDLTTLKNDYRAALDQAGARAADMQTIVDEGSVAFSLNIDLSVAVQNAVSSQASATLAG